MDCCGKDARLVAKPLCRVSGKVIVWVNAFSWCVVTPSFKANGGDDIDGDRLEMAPDIHPTMVCAFAPTS